jgi:hypothetical protein
VIFRRREPLHEKLAREGGLMPPQGGPLDPRPPLETGIHGIARPREWDAVVTVEAPLHAEGAEFTVLPDGTMLVDGELPDDALRPLAEAVETQLAPPYRAEAVRRDGALWAVAATRIEVVEVPEEIGGDEIELAAQADHHTLLVDGDKVFGSVPTLETLAAGRHGDAWVVRAVRLDGSLWEVRTAAL